MVKHHTCENRCLFTPGANAVWRKEHFLRPEDLGNANLGIAQMEIEKEVVEQILTTTGQAGVEIVINAALAQRIEERVWKWVSHLLVSESEAGVMSGRDVNEDTWSVICQVFLDRGVKNVVITLGTKGAYYATAMERGRCLGYKVGVVDTTGTG